MTGPESSGTAQLCEACSRIDFVSIFTSHRCPVRSSHLFLYFTKCNCCAALNARGPHGWPSSGDPTATTTTCAFCTFYLECQIRSKDIAKMKGEDRMGVCLKEFHSLEGFRLRHVDEGKKDSPSKDYVHDVVALQIVGARWRAPARFDTQSNGHAILRLVDHDHSFSSMTTMLIRARETGGGLLARKIIPDKVNYRLIREWLQLCRSGHVLCDFREPDEGGVVGTGQIPGFQVIDCTTGNIVSFASLSGSTSSEEQSQTPPEYVTLSYVWGQGSFEGPVKITHPSGSQQQLSLPATLPLTIMDTIQVVQHLGYRYLWIDRYCIPQDDLPAKQIQVKNMGRIYSRSVLTIITAAGEGPEYGLPGVSERRRAEQLTVQVGAAAAGKGISLALYERPKAAIMDSKWYTRGWTFQEGLLSRRRLVFTDQMVYFQCYGMHGDEVLSLPIPDDPSGEDKDKFDEIRCLSLHDEESNFGSIFPRRITDWSNPDTVWDRIKDFSQRQLSFDADTLDAVAGIFGMYTAEKSNKLEGHGISFFYGMPIAPFQPQWNESNHQRLWTCELRTFWETWHESVAPGNTDPNSKLPLHVELDVTTSLTYKLVISLLWTDSWHHFRKFNSDPAQLLQQRSQFRRPMFPSWTWAGWKTCIVENDRFKSKIFDSRTKIHVEYEVEAGPSLAHAPNATKWRRLDWERDNKEILELARNAAYKIPARLVIRGTVLDMRLKWRDGEENNEAWWKKFGEWTVTWPQCMEGKVFDFPRGLLEDAKPGSHFSKGKEVQALALMLAGRTLLPMPGGSLCSPLAFLLLKPVTRMLNGRPETMYERVHKMDLYVEKEEYKAEWTPLAGLLREMEVRLC